MYDPRIGRVVLADPVVDDGLDGQAYNRYSYVTNNPLRYTDPSGYRRSGHARSAGVALLSLIVFNVAAPAAMPGWLWSAIQGATVGAVGTGSSSGAAWGAVSGLTFHGIGALKLGPAEGASFSQMVVDGGYWAKVSLHAAAGGTLNELQGGDFGHGFVTAGVSAGVSPLIDTIGDGRANARPARIVVQALVGGVVSKGMGGDFGSGALLAAIGRVMNAESQLAEDETIAEYREMRAGQLRTVDDAAQAASDAGDLIEEGYYLAAPVPVTKFGALGRWLKRWLGFGDEAAKGVALSLRPNGVPDAWVQQSAKKAGHVKFVNPANKHDYIRVKPDGTITQVRNGKAFDVNGNMVDLASPAAHGITPDKFIFRE
ncbi:MAG: RHS repeat-associated core domain-containing protein [Pseudomonadota bacterium]